MTDNANAYRLAFFTVVIYVAAITVGLRLLYYLAYVLGALLVLAFLWAQLNKRGLRIHRKVEPSQAQVGQVVQETIEIENLSWLRKLWLEIRDRSTLPGHRVGAVVSLQGRSARQWQVRTRCVRRGLYRLGPTVVMTGDPFGLFGAAKVFDDKGELLVYPPTVPLESFGLPANDLQGGTSTQKRSYHTTLNAAGVREYMPGDPMNRIHWSVSARAQKLMIKEFELDPTSDVWIVLDLNEDAHVPLDVEEGYSLSTDDSDELPRRMVFGGRSASASLVTPIAASRLSLEPSTEEYSVVVAASLAAHFIGLGRTVGLIAWGQHRVTLPADRGGRQLIKILRALAVLRAEGTTPLEEVLTGESRLFDRQDSLIIITPSLDEKWVTALQFLLHKGLKAVVGLVEPATFGGDGNALMVVSALSTTSVPTYLIKRDDDIDASLSQPASPGAARNLR